MPKEERRTNKRRCPAGRDETTNCPGKRLKHNDMDKNDNNIETSQPRNIMMSTRLQKDNWLKDPTMKDRLCCCFKKVDDYRDTCLNVTVYVSYGKNYDVQTNQKLLSPKHNV